MDSTEKEPVTNDPHLTGRMIEQITDAQGFDKAYQQGDGFVNNKILYVAGSHTARDWFDDVTKIAQWQYVPAGVSYITDAMKSWWGSC